jgi:hypothetical protein
MTEDEIIALAVAHNLGRTMAPLGMQTGDVFVTDQSYRTHELLSFSESVARAECEACAKLAELCDDVESAARFIRARANA